MKFVTVVLLGFALVLAACGGSGKSVQSNAATGFWSVTLTNPANPNDNVLSFTFSMTQNGNSLSGASLNLNQPTSCFGPDATISGQLGAAMGAGTGMAMTVMSGPSTGTAQNTLTMQGTMNSGFNGANGTFTLTGATPGCVSTNGTFTMNKQLPAAM